MTPEFLFDLALPDADATSHLGRALASLLAPGDTVLLEGPLGSGKTHLARATIQALLKMPEDVPSPSFTLVQTYETLLGELIHADLYRLSGPREVDETGLTDQLGEAVTLIEWPDRLAGTAPTDALTITLEPNADGTSRLARLAGPSRFAPLAKALSA